MSTRASASLGLIFLVLGGCRSGDDSDVLLPDSETEDDAIAAEDDGAMDDSLVDDGPTDCAALDVAATLAVDSIPPEGRLVAVSTRFTYDFSGTLDPVVALSCTASAGTFETCDAHGATWLAPPSRGDETLRFTFAAGGCSVAHDVLVRVRTGQETATIGDACFRFESPESPDIHYVRGDAVTMGEGFVVALCTTGDVAAQEWLFVRMVLRNVGDLGVDIQNEVCPNCEVTVWVEPPVAPGGHPTDDMLSCPCGIVCDPSPVPGARHLAPGEYLPAWTFQGKFAMPERSCGTQFLQGPGDLTVLGQYHGRRPDGTPLASDTLSVPLAVTSR